MKLFKSEVTPPHPMLPDANNSLEFLILTDTDVKEHLFGNQLWEEYGNITKLYVLFSVNLVHYRHIETLDIIAKCTIICTIT